MQSMKKTEAPGAAIFRRDFTLVVVGQIISLFGNAILRFALPLYLLRATGSSALFGMVTAASFLPMIVLSLLGGVLADRVNKRNIMVALDFSTAALIAVFYLVLGRLPIVPLFTVMLACVINIGGDLLLVEGFHLGAAGAALATVAAQAVSVVVSLAVIQRRKDRLPFHFSRRSVRFDGRIIALELRLGLPVALQELLVGTSFLVIQTIVNTFGVTASAGVGVAEKVCVFLMLVSSAYMHSMSAFVAQNMGAGQPRRAKRALGYGILTAFAAGLVMAWLAFFHGDTLSLLFAKDAAVAAASHSYLKAYAIDCMLTPFLFCFMGYYNGCEKTLFVMIQGIIGAFGVRIPIAYLVSRIPGATLFQIGLGTPASSTVQIVLCLAMFLYLERRQRREALCGAVTGP